ncbi:hypothetical protein NQ317_006564 [Molorchus minor]|uniref:Tyr recombinase domain-containing protein n=1 Tax=Molorchus minor TaxID=1323400 RepID=A0ABQ9K0J2_9CUCU|nr:hypothetical protein NQ317_006564 [Molorchus minor]
MQSGKNIRRYSERSTGYAGKAMHIQDRGEGQHCEQSPQKQLPTESSQQERVQQAEKKQQEQLEVNFAGRIKYFYQNWVKITNNKQVLTWVKGYKIPFEKSPTQTNKPPRKSIIPPRQQKYYSECIGRLLKTGAIKKVKSVRSQFLSSYFLRKKPNGHLISICPATRYGWLYTKNFEREKYVALIKNNGKKNINEEALDVMTASFSKSTLKQYNSTFAKWWVFLGGDKNKIFHPNTLDILNFLNAELKKGQKYGSLNTHRSALNFISNAGKSDIIDRFMKGVFKMKPSYPKYENIWDPLPVLVFIEKLYPLENLPLEKLTTKVVLLIALCSAQRCQTLSKIRISNIIKNEIGIDIIITDIIKTSAPKRQQPRLIFPFYKEKPQLCTASTIIHYIESTKSLRNGEDFFKPHRPANPQTISKWIKKGLNSSGINTETYTGHSTRHAASSAALRAGINISNIKVAAGWSEKSNAFLKFYNRPLSSKEFFANYVKTLKT